VLNSYVDCPRIEAQESELLLAILNILQIFLFTNIVQIFVQGKGARWNLTVSRRRHFRKRRLINNVFMHSF